ncbi:MAG: lipid biosynthesis B12-binding/radical SAM protein [Desulfuromonadaceae bacterium]
MSRVFLLSSNATIDPYPVYPLGMAVVAAALSAAGHDVCQFDYLAAGRSPDLLRERIEAFAPDFIGLSLRNLDNADSFSQLQGWYLDAARELLAAVRQVSRAPLILGGPAFSLLPEAILDYLGGDYGIVGEGERALPELLQALAENRPVPRLIRDTPLLDGSRLAAPLYVPELVRFYRQESGLLNLQSKRGCPHRCSYCSYPRLEGERFRFRDPVQLAEEIERLQRDQGVDSLFFTDSVFNDPQGHYLLVAEEFLRRGLKLRWSGFFRPQGMGVKELSLLKRAGLFAMELGTDAASDSTLEGLQKGFGFAEVLAVNRAAVAVGIPCAHFVMFGGPGETETTLREGLANLARLEHCVVFAFSGIRILPDTALRQRAIAEGLLTADNDLLRPVYYFSPQLAPASLNRQLEKAFRGRRDRIFPPPEGQKRLLVMRRFGYRGLLWDTLVRLPQSAQQKVC